MIQQCTAAARNLAFTKACKLFNQLPLMGAEFLGDIHLHLHKLISRASGFPRIGAPFPAIRFTTLSTVGILIVIRKMVSVYDTLLHIPHEHTLLHIPHEHRIWKHFEGDKTVFEGDKTVSQCATSSPRALQSNPWMIARVHFGWDFQIYPLLSFSFDYLLHMCCMG